jgi:hypothetical protein
MAKSDTQTVARLLREYAHRASLRGGNPYRAKAYSTAADSLAALSQPLDRIIAAGTLTDIPGIGDAIADIVSKLHQTGSHSSLEKLRKEVPEGVLELFAVPGLRPKHGVAVEINAHPWRLDLDWRWHQKALDYGCIFSVNPDAHSIRELDHMHWGVEMARKGGVPPDRVLNAMTLPQLLRHLQRKRRIAERASVR